MHTVKEIRATTGLSQKAFAELLGIPSCTLEDWEGRKHKCLEYVAELIAYRVEHDETIPKKE